MNKFLSILVAVIGFSLVADVEAAKRMGGGSSVGKQRAAPAQQQAAPKAPDQQKQQAAPAAAPQQPSGMSKWLGPLAGLALGAGLFALFMNNGIAGALGGILMLAAIAFAAFFLFRFLRSRMGGQPAQYAGAGAGGGQPPVMDAQRSPMPLSGTAAPGSLAATLGGAQPATRWPAGFDAAGFVRQAKLNFVRLQDAYGQRNIAEIQDFLTPEMLREIETQMREHGAAEKIEVVTLTGEVLDVVEEGGQYIVSVQFSGMIREAPGAAPEPFNETWHLEKPVNGISGWLLSGIQQN